MDRLADIHHIRAHLDRQGNFADQVTCMRAHNAATQDLVR